MEEMIFTERLKSKSEDIKRAGLTIIEAPAGDGKTMAVMQILADIPHESVYWYTAIQPVKQGSFRWFLDQLERRDQTCVLKIRKMGSDIEGHLEEICECLVQAVVTEPIYIVLDNFHYIEEEWNPAILATLSRRKTDGLHVICVGQYMGVLHPVVEQHGGMMSTTFVTREDFVLTRDDILKAARERKIDLLPGQLKLMLDKTDGWGAAVAYYMNNLQQHGERIFGLSDINELLYDLFWKKLTEEEKKILLRLSLFDWIDLKDLSELLETKARQNEKVRHLLVRVPLMRYLPLQRQYIPHDELKRFLRFQLLIEKPEFHDEVCRYAGNIHKKAGLHRRAVECFYKAGDYEGILSCQLAGLMMEEFAGNSYQEIAEEVFERCPEEILKRYPVSVMRLCYSLFALGSFKNYQIQLERIRQMFWEGEDRHWRGEWLLLSAFEEFPDVEKMTQRYREASGYLTRASEVFVSEEPFMFGCTSMWYLFYTRRGEMIETAGKLDEMMKIYNKLTSGHGAGAAQLYLAEALGAQGRFEESEIEAHKAQLLAEKADNTTIIYGTAELLGINALFQSDMPALKKTVEYLEHKYEYYSRIRPTAMQTTMVETVRSYFLALMMETERSAAWTMAEADSLAGLNFTNFLSKICRTTDLVIKREYRRAIATQETTLHLDKRFLSVPALSMSYVGLSLCYMAIGQMRKAIEYLAKTFDLVEADKNYVYVACYRKYFSMIEKAPAFTERYENVMREIEQIGIQYTRAEKKRVFDMLDQQNTEVEELTGREREIALLAARGMRNSEIAQELHISENTVKSHMKIIFRKLGVDRRSYLADVLK